MLPALDISDLRYAYGDRQALKGVGFTVPRGEIFALLGPNGGGKTTLFRIVATLIPPRGGSVRVFGIDVAADPAQVRRHLGVVFQSPALDVRLTVAENLRHHGHLYGLRGDGLTGRVASALQRVGLSDRARDLTGDLSGGLRRRAEIAKAFLHGPDLLLMDEPSTGLDPAARRDIWTDLRRLRDLEGTTIVMTTHLMEEAAACDRVGILHEGRLVAIGSPHSLTEAIGGDVILISTRDAAALSHRMADRFHVTVDLVDGRLRIERPRAHEFITDLVEAFPGEIDAVTFGKPTLEDVFVHHTGRRLD